MIKWSIQEEDITVVNIYAPNVGAPEYVRQMLTDIKGEMDSNTIIVGNVNTPLSPMDRSSKMNIHKDTSFKWYIKQDGLYWYLQDTPSKNNRRHFLLKCSWNILQGRSYPDTNQDLVNLRKLKLYQVSFLTTTLWD